MVSRSMVRACGSVLVLGLLVAGCTPDPGPGPGGSPSPAVSSAAPSPTPTENAQERLQRLDFEAAKKAYLTGSAEYQRLLMAGGATKPTTVLKDTTSGFQLEALMNALKFMKKNDWHTDRPSVQTVSNTGGWASTELELLACEDTSGVKFLNNTGKEVFKDRKLRYIHTLTAKKEKGVWKIVDGESRAVRTFDGEAACTR